MAKASVDFDFLLATHECDHDIFDGWLISLAHRKAATCIVS